MNTNVTAIILAAGTGSRMQLDITKQRLLVNGESILYRAVKVFSECEKITSIIVVVREDEISFAEEELTSLKKIIKIVPGGKCREESAKIGFDFVPENTEYVAIHDGARCFVTAEIIEAVLSDAEKYGAATASCKVYDTVKAVDENNNIIKTVPRDSLMRAETPQIFKKELYKKAIDATLSFENVTDDNMLLENISVMPHCTDTGRYNIKITTVEDLSYANYILKEIRNEL